MDGSSSDEFDKFVLHTKVLELLHWHRIKPVNVWVDITFDPDDKKILLALSDRTVTDPDGSTPTVTNPEHQKQLKRLHADLGMPSGRDIAVFNDYTELYNKLCAVIEKAPKSMTRFR